MKRMRRMKRLLPIGMFLYVTVLIPAIRMTHAIGPTIIAWRAPASP